MNDKIKKKLTKEDIEQLERAIFLTREIRKLDDELSSSRDEITNEFIRSKKYAYECELDAISEAIYE